MVLTVLHGKSKFNPIWISSFFVNHSTAIGLFYWEWAIPVYVGLWYAKTILYFNNPKGKRGYVFIIQGAIHTIEGDISKCTFFRIMPLFQLKTFLTFCNISLTMKDIYLKLIVCVRYPKSNPYHPGRQFKMLFSRFMSLFFFYLDLFILYQAHHSRAFAPACHALVFLSCYRQTSASEQESICHLQTNWTWINLKNCRLELD